MKNQLSGEEKAILNSFAEGDTVGMLAGVFEMGKEEMREYLAKTINKLLARLKTENI